jgi:hypothetical protein
MAVRRRSLEIVTLLLEYGADPLLQDKVRVILDSSVCTVLIGVVLVWCVALCGGVVLRRYVAGGVCVASLGANCAGSLSYVIRAS